MTTTGLQAQLMALMTAEGETMVNRVYHHDRGFERLEDKLGLRRRHLSPLLTGMRL